MNLKILLLDSDGYVPNQIREETKKTVLGYYEALSLLRKEDRSDYDLLILSESEFNPAVLREWEKSDRKNFGPRNTPLGLIHDLIKEFSRPMPMVVITRGNRNLVFEQFSFVVGSFASNASFEEIMATAEKFFAEIKKTPSKKEVGCRICKQSIEGEKVRGIFFASPHDFHGEKCLGSFQKGH